MGLNMGDRVRVSHGKHAGSVGILVTNIRDHQRYPIFKEPRITRHRIAFEDGRIGWARKVHVGKWHLWWEELVELTDGFHYYTRFQRAQFRRRLTEMDA